METASHQAEGKERRKRWPLVTASHNSKTSSSYDSLDFSLGKANRRVPLPKASDAHLAKRPAIETSGNNPSPYYYHNKELFQHHPGKRKETKLGQRKLPTPLPKDSQKTRGEKSEDRIISSKEICPLGEI